MTDIQRAMGIGRQSLYDTFGDKRQIFGESLELFNTCAELAPHAPEIRKQARKGVLILQSKLEHALRRAQEQGTARADTDAHTMAVFLTTQGGGLAVMSKGGASREELQAAADTAVDAVAIRPGA